MPACRCRQPQIRPLRRVRIVAVWWLLAVGVVLLAGCTFRSGSDDAPPAPDALRADLDAQYATIARAQAQALDLWTRVIDGETVTCQTVIPVPDPVILPATTRAAYPQADAVQSALNSAVQDVATAAALWQAECADARERVPLAVARDGRAAALAAGGALGRAAEQRAAW